MPLTALQRGKQVDSTACTDEVWAALYRASPRAVLTCRACGTAVHAKVSPRGLRFFAHDRLTPSCPTTGETPEHLGLKKSIAELVRAAGGTAIIEALPRPEDTGGWRADVLGVGASGHRIAFEVQLAAMTTTEGTERTEKYAGDGIQTVWVTTRSAPWLYTLPGVQVGPHHDALIAQEGVAHLVDGAWQVDQGSLADLMPQWLAGLMGHTTGVRLSEQRPTRWLYRTEAVVCAPVRDIRRWTHQQEQRQAAEQQARAEREAYARNLQALYNRQERLLQVVVPEVAARGGNGDRVWLGVPATPWDGHLPVALRDALGNEKTGQGCVVWAGQSRDSLTLRAVVCPVANAVGPGLGRNWQSRGATARSGCSSSWFPRSPRRPGEPTGSTSGGPKPGGTASSRSAAAKPAGTNATGEPTSCGCGPAPPPPTCLYIPSCHPTPPCWARRPRPAGGTARSASWSRMPMRPRRSPTSSGRAPLKSP